MDAASRDATAGILAGMSRPILVAHGGGANLADGHVLEGVERAIAAGAGMLEIDVRRTVDGVLVVDHGGLPNERSFHGTRYADIAGPRVPALEDVLSRSLGRIAVDLELKETGYEEEVVALARPLGTDRVILTSFLDRALMAVRGTHSDIATGLIVGRRSSLHNVRALARDAFPFERLRATGSELLVPNHLLDLTGMRARAEGHGVPLLVWTVNNPHKLADALHDARLLGVVTDRVDLAPPSR